MFKIGTRVVKLDERGVPTSVLGTILDLTSSDRIAFVEWDDSTVSIIGTALLIPHQQLKAMFKHGPKLTKKSLANASESGVSRNLSSTEED